MPQMAPTWWTMLFMVFNATLIVLSIILYFQKKMILLKKEDLKKEDLKTNWKW
uniref:ATP synthase complex subunit 8 n=1 Tax=Thaumastocoris safordi TaxID=1589682 RepID=A0A8T9ZXT3_9HEMI|nr:ATPase subunit 8 [Thaumastocoris safordi]